MPIYISDLDKKIDLIIDALQLGTQAELARLIGIAPATLAGYKTAGVNTMPQKHVDAIARVLVERLPGRMTQKQAGIALESEAHILQFAVAPHSSSAFGNLLAEVDPSVPISIHPRGPGAGLGMIDDEPPDPDVERLPIETPFHLTVGGPPAWFVVVLARSLLGWHFAIPRTDEAVKIGKDRSVHAPKTGLRFSIGGLWTFHAFVIQSALAPTLILRKDYTAPISDDDLNTFALQLRDRTRTRKFLFGRLPVFVDAHSERAARAPATGSTGQ